MCGNPFKPPEIPEAPRMPKAPAPLQSIGNDTAAARDRTLKKMAARASIASTNKTAAGLGEAQTTSTQLLGQ